MRYGLMLASLVTLAVSASAQTVPEPETPMACTGAMANLDATTLQLRAVSTAFTHSALFTSPSGDHMAVQCECLGPEGSGRLISISGLDVVAEFGDYSLTWRISEAEATAPVRGPATGSQVCSCTADTVHQFTPTSGQVMPSQDGDITMERRRLRWSPGANAQEDMNQLQSELQAQGLGILATDADGASFIFDIGCAN